METSDHTARLRDTKIDEYNAIVNDFDFVPYADKYKTASYYLSDNHNLANSRI